MAENPDSHDHVLPKSTNNLCAASISTGNRKGTFALPRKARDRLSMKLSCNAASSTANICDNVWQIAGSAVKGLAKKQ